MTVTGAPSSLLVDCEWANWSGWSGCPECHGELTDIYEEGTENVQVSREAIVVVIACLSLDLKEFKEMRTRKVKTPAKYRGKRCGAGNGLFDHESRQGECTSRTPACPEEGFCYLSNWGEWSMCKTGDDGKCHKKMGTRDREELEIICCTFGVS